MNIFLMLLYKDFLVLWRDRGGLAMLFIMPLALVLIMTSLQDTTFRSINESGIKLLLINHDDDSLGISISREISNSNLFSVSTMLKGNEHPGDEEVKEAVALGEYQIGLIIPDKATQQIRERVRSNVTAMFSGMESEVSNSDSLFLILYIDPTTKESFKESLRGSLGEFSSRIESNIILHELTSELNSMFMLELKENNISQQEAVYISEEYAMLGENQSIPNSVQHNVPAWTIFAMFFIVIPFAGAMIKEREEGSLSRLLTLPCSYTSILLSKVLVFLVICYLQFLLILLMGIYLFPFLNLPALEINSKMGLLSVVALTTGMAAVCYGLAVGSIARTHQQASVFASISVVILAALGGVWVPVFIMPPLLRKLSIISPLNWGLNGFYDVLIRDVSFLHIMPYCIQLLIFSLLCLAVARFWGRTKIRNGISIG